MSLSAKDRMQNDIENICEMAIDDINAALWHFGTNKKSSCHELRKALENIKTALELIEDK
jgi:hypothetical protein